MMKYTEMTAQQRQADDNCRQQQGQRRGPQRRRVGLLVPAPHHAAPFL